MTSNENPRTFYWKYQELRGRATKVGRDGFLPISPTENPQIAMEVTLRFEGRDLKGYADVFDIEQEYAPTEVFLNDCFSDEFFT
jgi:hypothetical protein